jgi:hypothetical protein
MEASHKEDANTCFYIHDIVRICISYYVGYVIYYVGLFSYKNISYLGLIIIKSRGLITTLYFSLFYFFVGFIPFFN